MVEYIDFTEPIKKNLVILGGSSSLGSKCSQFLSDFNVYSLGSKDCDIRDENQVISIMDKYDPDILVNFVTISEDNLIKNCNNDSISKCLETNIYGNFYAIKSFTNYCINKNKRGSFIYISSILSENPVRGASIYSACKAFNDNLIKTAALENARKGIRFNSIRLGYFGEGLCSKLPEEFQEKLKKEIIPLGKWGTPENITDAIKYLSNNTYVTGTAIQVTGGL